MKTTWTIDLGDLGEQDLTIEYKYTPATPDVMYLSNGDPGYPGESAEIELISVTGLDDIQQRLEEFLLNDDSFYEHCNAIHLEERYDHR